jgi:hypothetical protein
MTINVYWSSGKVPIILVEIFGQIFENNSNVMKVHVMKLVVSFCSFAKALINEQSWYDFP